MHSHFWLIAIDDLIDSLILLVSFGYTHYKNMTTKEVGRKQTVKFVNVFKVQRAFRSWYPSVHCLSQFTSSYQTVLEFSFTGVKLERNHTFFYPPPHLRSFDADLLIMSYRRCLHGLNTKFKFSIPFVRTVCFFFYLLF